MKRTSIVWLVFIQWVLALEWFHSGWGKWSDQGFINNIGKTLATFAAKNPHPWYASFITNTAIPNARLFGNLTRTGELSVGIILVVGGIILLGKKKLPMAGSLIVGLACLAAALMNLNFFLASGYTSPSTWGVNAVMGLIELLLGLYYLSNSKQLAS